MTGRTPACEDSGIGERMRELQAERMRAIAGCNCPQRDTTGNTVHTPLCPLRTTVPSQMALTLEAMQRARARVSWQAQKARRAADAAAQASLALPTAPCPAERYLDHIERAVATKAARHRVLLP